MNLIKKLQSKFDDKREIIDLNTFNDPLVFSIDCVLLFISSTYCLLVVL